MGAATSKKKEKINIDLTHIISDNITTDDTVKSTFALTREIGQGRFGKVWEAQPQVSTSGGNNPIALKIVQKKSLKDYDDIQNIKNEVGLTSKLEHVNILKIMDSMETDKNIYIIMELVLGGNLVDFLRAIPYSTSFSWWSERQAARIFYQILCGIDFLHSQGIVHGDLKPENILCSRTPPKNYTSNFPDDIILKIGDFGFARPADEMDFANQRWSLKRVSFVSNRKSLKKNMDSHRKFAGTPSYCAPEVISRQSFGTYSDVWSSGIILYLILSGELPVRVPDWSSHRGIELLKQGNFLMEGEGASDVWKIISGDAKSLVRSLTQVPIAHRLTASQAISHRWIASNL